MGEKIGFGTEIIDGKIYRLDSLSLEELSQLEESLETQINKLEEEIMNDLKTNIDNTEE